MLRICDNSVGRFSRAITSHICQANTTDNQTFNLIYHYETTNQKLEEDKIVATQPFDIPNAREIIGDLAWSKCQARLCTTSQP